MIISRAELLSDLCPHRHAMQSELTLKTSWLFNTSWFHLTFTEDFSTPYKRHEYNQVNLMAVLTSSQTIQWRYQVWSSGSGSKPTGLCLLLLLRRPINLNLSPIWSGLVNIWKADRRSAFPASSAFSYKFWNRNISVYSFVGLMYIFYNTQFQCSHFFSSRS